MSWDDRITTWRKEIFKVMEQNEDKDINNYVCTITEEELDIEFDAGYGDPNGLHSTLWTTWWVYFSQQYDGSGMKKKLISSDRKVYKLKPKGEYPKKTVKLFPEILRSACICIYIGESQFDTVIIPASLDQMFVSEYNEFFNQITSL